MFFPLWSFIENPPMPARLPADSTVSEISPFEKRGSPVLRLKRSLSTATSGRAVARAKGG